MGIFAQKLPCRANRIDLQLEGALVRFGQAFLVLKKIQEIHI